MTKVQRQFNGERIDFSRDDAGTTDILCKLMNLNLNYTLYTQVNSKCIIGLNVKLLEENIRENLCGLRLSKKFLDMTLKARSIRENKR